MGICVSCDAAEEGAVTARVVMPGGELREYSQPVTAAMALEEAGEGWFLCDADGVGFEGHVVAVAGDEELRPGQIYFVLPAEVRRRSLTREEVAALAVKASAALVKAAAATAPSPAGGRRWRGAVAPLVFPLPEEDDTAGAAARKQPAVVRKRRVACRGGRATKFSPDLTAIPEAE
ncbi:hypothetical protein E2562_014166 [Oryza meyeriana var. granulata]|uniref:Uncharacterized protein n=1 Tax=Oryza meyeriana var. granulata TaxID=110450 RepID=A0A6G1BKL9_9ORYZ|nr:hypothetical protein E2562_014166 [Oryza meyeriana var. granulata]